MDALQTDGDPLATGGVLLDRRIRLLERIVDYVLENGISHLTLRGLASAVGSNHRMLLYYFGSREELVVAALERAQLRFPGIQGVIDNIDDRQASLDARLTESWQIVGDPQNLAFHRLFFEIFGLAGFERVRFDALLSEIGTAWVAHVTAAIADEGVPDARAEIFAHEIVALWRGLQAALLSGGDPIVVDRAARDATTALLQRIRSAGA